MEVTPYKAVKYLTLGVEGHAIQICFAHIWLNMKNIQKPRLGFIILYLFTNEKKTLHKVLPEMCLVFILNH